MAGAYHEYAADMPHQIFHMMVHCVRDVTLHVKSLDGWNEIESSITMIMINIMLQECPRREINS